jgi:signal transduction histidine kinase
MTAIAGYADILAENAGSQEAREQAEKIYDRATNVSELGEQVRRIEQALDIDRQPAPLDPERLIGEIVDWFRSNVPEATIRIDADENSRIVADELLKIAVENLLENAIEHHPDAATIDIEIRTVDDTWVDISISDDGPGIPEREQAVVSGDRRITQLDHSMGLGLWISRWIVRGIDGRFLFGDCEDGSEVILRLPRTDEGTDAE